MGSYASSVLWAWLSSVLIVAILWPSVALGQHAASERAAAEALYDQALTLMEEKRYSEACPKLEESQRLDPGIGTLLYLGHCYEQEGRLTTAWITYKDASYAAADANQPDREAMASERAARLKPLLAHLTVVVSSPRIPGLEVLRDGEALRRAMWGVSVPIDPGSYLLEGRAPNRESWSQMVEVPKGAGTTKVVVPPLEVTQKEAAPAPVPLREPAAPPEAAPTAPAAPVNSKPSPQAQPTSADSESGSSQGTWGWISLGTGGAAVAAGAVFGLMAASADAEAEEHCRLDNPSLCSEEGVALGKDAQEYAGVSTLATGVGAALVITGTVLLLTAPSEENSTEVAVGVGASLSGDGGYLGVRGLW